MTDIPADVLKAAHRLSSCTDPDILLDEITSILADRAAQAERIRELEAKLSEALRLLGRYRLETPAGHSPHMICAEVDEFVARAKEQETR